MRAHAWIGFTIRGLQKVPITRMKEVQKRKRVQTVTRIRRMGVFGIVNKGYGERVNEREREKGDGGSAVITTTDATRKYAPRTWRAVEAAAKSGRIADTLRTRVARQRFDDSAIRMTDGRRRFAAHSRASSFRVGRSSTAANRCECLL